MEIPEELRSQVRMYTDWAQQMVQDYGDTMSEADVETKLVEPMLEILQWDPRSMDVRKRHPIKVKKGRYIADYALVTELKTRAIIEVKKAANDLNDEDVMQLMEYAFYEKADISILTNGSEWRVYDPYHLRSMIFRFDISNMENNLDCLWFLSKSSIESGQLKREINRRYAIERIFEYIEENRDNWVEDIVSTSTGLTIVSRITVDKNLLIKEPLQEPRPLPVGIDTIKPISEEVELSPITEDYTGQSISHFWFNESLHEVHSWRELLLKLCEMLNAKHGDQFSKVLELKLRKRKYFALRGNQLKAPKKIPNTNIYVETNVSAHNITKLCRALIAEFDYSDEDLKVGVHSHTMEETLAGASSNVRAAFNLLQSKAREFGDDVKIMVRKTYIVLMRNYAFAILGVSSDRIDVGLSLDPSLQSGRLRDITSRSSKISKGTSVSKVEEVDEQLVGWMRQSYDRS